MRLLRTVTVLFAFGVLVVFVVLGARSCGGMPEPRAGGDRLGVSIAPYLPVKLDAPATLVRWWTDSCPFCEASLPALEELRTRYAPAGLATLAVYHPKPPREVDEAEARATALRLGYGGHVVVDPEWKGLRGLWLDTAPEGGRPATSASFLVDAEGIVRFVHPGPEFHPGGPPEHARCRADFAALDAAIRALLDF